MRKRHIGWTILMPALLLGAPAFAQSGACGTVGSGGAAATDSTSATTLGTAGACQTEEGTSATLGTGGSAAAVDGKVKSRTHIVDNPNNLQGTSQARAQDGGEWSRSKTKTRVKDETLSSRTRTMAHEPGGAPTKSTSNAEVDLSEPQATGSIGGQCPPDAAC